MGTSKSGKETCDNCGVELDGRWDGQHHSLCDKCIRLRDRVAEEAVRELKEKYPCASVDNDDLDW